MALEKMSVLKTEDGKEFEIVDAEARKQIKELSGAGYEIGHGLKLEDGVLSVDTTDSAEQDNTRPITSGGVYKEIGNIEALLKTI